MDARLRDRSSAPMVRPLPAPLQGLRVALVHDWLTGLRGGEKCLEVLCEAFPDATIHTLLHTPGSVGATIGRMSIRTSPLQRIPGIEKHYRKMLPIMPLAARCWNVGDVDLVVSLSHCVAKAVRVPRGVPHVSYCFTPMRYAWEGRSAYMGNWRKRPLQRWAASVLLDRLRRWDRSTAQDVTQFVAISETVQRRIIRSYRRESRIIEPPVDTQFYSPHDGTRGEDYLCVSALVPYKKIDQAVRACSESGRALTVIGSGPDRGRLERLAGPTVRFLGWQPDDVIRDHYRRCRALLFPGEEDFGIVPAEALACGAPVIALRAGGVAETIRPGMGTLYEVPTAEGLLAALDQWEKSGMPHDPQAARSRAEDFARPLFRERLLNHLAEVVVAEAGHKSPPSPHLTLARSARVERI